jgi:Domain of unknown function (DUF6883)
VRKIELVFRHDAERADGCQRTAVFAVERRRSKIWRRVGYQLDNPQTLESDLRGQHLSLDVTRTHETAYGVVCEIEGHIKTPSGKSVRFCSIWQVDTGTDVPRFITMYPR